MKSPLSITFYGLYNIVQHFYNIHLSVNALSTILAHHFWLQRRSKRVFLRGKHELQHAKKAGKEKHCEKCQTMRDLKHSSILVSTVHKEMEIFTFLVVTSMCFKNM